MPSSVASSSRSDGDKVIDEQGGTNNHTTSSETTSVATVDDEKQDVYHAHRDASPSDSIDSVELVNLPYRTLTESASMKEYTSETATGLHAVQSHRSGRTERYELVTFKDGDPENPKNWSKAFKWWCTMNVAITCFCVAFNSSVITSDLAGVSETFHVSEEVSLLTVTLFVVGFGVGPMAFAPMSEIFGRRVMYASTLLLGVIFIIPCAVAENIGTLLVCRLIDGIAFSAPVTLVGGTLADLWRNEERGVPMAAFSAAPFCGPVSRCFKMGTHSTLTLTRLSVLWSAGSYQTH